MPDPCVVLLDQNVPRAIVPWLRHLKPTWIVHHSSSTAMWMTSVILIAGFLVLMFSGFKMNSDMGLMAAITIGLALAMDFLLLPTLLIKVEGKAEARADTRIGIEPVSVAD